MLLLNNYLACLYNSATFFSPQVEKLMNRLLYSQYKLKKASILQNSTCPEVERTLYHGTSEASVKEICVHGFNRSFCGKNGTFFFSPFSRLTLMVVSDILVSPCSHCLWSGGLFRCQLRALRPESVFTPERRWIQVYICVQSSNRRLH